MSSTPAVETEGTAFTNGNAVPRELLFKFLVIGDYGVGKKVSVALFIVATRVNFNYNLLVIRQHFISEPLSYLVRIASKWMLFSSMGFTGVTEEFTDVLSYTN